MQEGYKYIFATIGVVFFVSILILCWGIVYGINLKEECNEYNQDYFTYFIGHFYTQYNCFIKMTDGSKLDLYDFKEIERIRNMQTKEPIRR